MIERLTQRQLDNKIQSFLDRKGEQFPELHLTDTNDITVPQNVGRDTSVWFRQVQNT